MGATAAAVADKKGGKGKLIIIAAVALLAAVGAGGWFTGIIPKLLHLGGGEHAAAPAEHGGGGARGGHGSEGKAAPAAAAVAGAPIFVDLPDIVANLNAGRRTAFIKLKAKLEVARPEDQHAVQAALPRVLDLFQGYLREMRPEELRGTAGTYRLREELAARTNIAAAPARVLGVLFTEVIVQ